MNKLILIFFIFPWLENCVCSSIRNNNNNNSPKNCNGASSLCVTEKERKLTETSRGFGDSETVLDIPLGMFDLQVLHHNDQYEILFGKKSEG